MRVFGLQLQIQRWRHVGFSRAGFCVLQSSGYSEAGDCDRTVLSGQVLLTMEKYTGLSSLGNSANIYPSK